MGVAIFLSFSLKKKRKKPTDIVLLTRLLILPSNGSVNVASMNLPTDLDY